MNWIDKQRNIVDFALSSLLRRWKKNLALLCVYTFVVFIVASVVFFAEALKREAGLVLEGAPTLSCSASSPAGTTSSPAATWRNSAASPAYPM